MFSVSSFQFQKIGVAHSPTLITAASMNKIQTANIALLFHLFVLFWSTMSTTSARAGDLVVKLSGGDGVTAVGAFNRWDQDGNHRKAVNPKAVIDSPEVDFRAVNNGGGKWVFKDLPAGRYDLVIMGPGLRRIEGWHYPPVLEFDPFFGPGATVAEDAAEFIADDIKKSRHYENKVVPLAMGGDKKVVRVLVMLIRDLPTSYTPGAGTMRFEVWQYTWNYGGWVKEKRTRVLHRVLLQVSELRRWNWLWEPKLGGIELSAQAKTIDYKIPDKSELKKLRGLHANME